MSASQPPFRTVAHSTTTISELMIPSYANFGGKIHGGILLSMMDKIAYACASKHAGSYCVTVNVDNVDFMAAVDVGDLVTMRASVNYVGRTSMMVGIRVEAENVSTGDVRHTNTSYFTMVAKGEDNKPRTVPGLLLETREQVRRYMEAIKRRQVKQRYRDALDDEQASLAVETQLHLLEHERCRIADGVMDSDE